LYNHQAKKGLTMKYRLNYFANLKIWYFSIDNERWDLSERLTIDQRASGKAIGF
jgi:hypothetical protein